MRIGFFSDRYLPQTDGVAHSVEMLRGALERMGHEVYVVAPAPALGYEETDPRVIRFPAFQGVSGRFNYLFSLLLPPVAARRLHGLRLDVVHFHTVGQVGLLGAYYAVRHDLPLVTTYHTDLMQYVAHYRALLPWYLGHAMVVPWVTGTGFKGVRSALSTLRPRSVDHWNRRIVEHVVTLAHDPCDLVIAPSRKMEQHLRGWQGESPVVLLPNGVDEIPTSDSLIATERARYGLGPDDDVIISVGRLGTEKNLELLLQAFALLAADRPRAKLVVVGDGPDRARLTGLAATAGLADRCLFTGRIEHADVGGLYALADVFAFPSLTDVNPLVLNEAALARTPLVACDPLISDILIDGETGLLAEARADAFAAKLVWLLDHPREAAAMGQAGRRVALRYSTAAQAEELVRLYHDAGQHHGHHGR